jgi:hypothetical protein
MGQKFINLMILLIIISNVNIYSQVIVSVKSPEEKIRILIPEVIQAINIDKPNRVKNIFSADATNNNENLDSTITNNLLNGTIVIKIDSIEVFSESNAKVFCKIKNTYDTSTVIDEIGFICTSNAWKIKNSKFIVALWKTSVEKNASTGLLKTSTTNSLTLDDLIYSNNMYLQKKILLKTE